MSLNATRQVEAEAPFRYNLPFSHGALLVLVLHCRLVANHRHDGRPRY